MINISKNLQLNTNMLNVLNVLKREAAQKGKIIFSDIKESGENIQSNCPLGTHIDKKPSFGINVNNGLWSCFACQEKGNLIQLVQRILNLDNYTASKQWLIDNFNSSLLLENDRPKLDKTKLNKKHENIEDIKPIKYITEDELKQYRYYHPYMYVRGLTNKIIEQYDIGYDANFRLKLKNGTFSNPIQCLTFPNKDKYGNCLFIARRSVNSKFFHYPEDVEKPVYGLYEMYKYYNIDKITTILICESMLDALKFNAYNTDETKFALALNGLGTKQQFYQLQQLPQKLFILATDNDIRGLNARQSIKNNIKGKIFKQIKLPKNIKDLNDCSPDEINNLNFMLI